jgi:hypothetical protein
MPLENQILTVSVISKAAVLRLLCAVRLPREQVQATPLLHVKEFKVAKNVTELKHYRIRFIRPNKLKDISDSDRAPCSQSTVVHTRMLEAAPDRKLTWSWRLS